MSAGEQEADRAIMSAAERDEVYGVLTIAVLIVFVALLAGLLVLAVV